jgi:hypothetical protein
MRESSYQPAQKILHIRTHPRLNPLMNLGWRPNHCSFPSATAQEGASHLYGEGDSPALS